MYGATPPSRCTTSHVTCALCPRQLCYVLELNCQHAVAACRHCPCCSTGVLHGDIRHANFVAGQGATGMKVLDFEQSTVVGDASAASPEVQLELERELQAVDSLL